MQQNNLEIPTAPFIVQVVNRVSRPKGLKPSMQPTATQPALITVQEVEEVLPTQTVGKKRGRPKKNINVEAVANSFNESDDNEVGNERPVTQQKAKKSKKNSANRK
jgi:hypothetical protein